MLYLPLYSLFFLLDTRSDTSFTVFLYEGMETEELLQWFPDHCKRRQSTTALHAGEGWVGHDVAFAVDCKVTDEEVLTLQ